LKYWESNHAEDEARLSQLLVESKGFDTLFPRLSRELKNNEQQEETMTPMTLPQLSTDEMLLMSSSGDEDEA